MALYVKFMLTLAFGLAGLGLVMKILMDRVFVEGNFFAEIGEFIRSLTQRPTLVRLDRAEDILMLAEDTKPRELTTRLIEQRRERLNELSEVETAVNRPRIIAPDPEYEIWGRN